ncbi:cobalamin biosynthesis protein CobW [Vreelandella malpeensis]|uniref:Cobalamin biosynthesis protein CobW n=1 Tax=Vreelandella malpeensis TaxID=1172368 RepID=A0ABS8DWI5_9GAMM|nr:cobalamin biosynthesis protein CobW [Halomonas malpeensis]MCB8890225.1 cobalamin biosynthesis protein CobW [Halomonas malpeensis]
MRLGSEQLSKIPATVVTGFLGSGKTTLLAGILRQMTGKRVAVIVNELGEQDIDASLLRSCALENAPNGETSGGHDMFEFANGCICCTVEERFLPVIQKLIARGERIDHILIETSALALPKPLVQAFKGPEVSQHCTVDAIITVIDGPAVAAQCLLKASADHDPTLQALMDDQLSAADLVLVSKTDLLDEEERRRVEAFVAAKAPAWGKTLFVDASLAADVARLEALLGIGAASEEWIDAMANPQHHAQHHIDACVMTLGEVDLKAFERALQGILSTHDIYRAKGFAAVPGKPLRRVVQAVGERLEGYFDRLWVSGEPRQTQLVIIGRHLDRDALHAALACAEVPQA